jgi:hypothetical protein
MDQPVLSPVPHLPPTLASDRLRAAIPHAVRAPSSHNSQPWSFSLQKDSLLLLADRTRGLPVVDPYDRELMISCGAALFNLRVALSHAGDAYAITTFPYPADPDVIAQIRIVKGHVDTAVGALFPAIALRATDRRPFPDQKVPAEVQTSILAAAEAEGAMASSIEDDGKRGEIADFVAAGDRTQFDDPRFRRELALWIHGERRLDGMSAYALGIPYLLDFATPIASLAIRTFDMGTGAAAAHRHLVQGSPLFVCLSTPVDDPYAWLTTGQALERVLLTLTMNGYAASFLNQPIEVDALRGRLRDAMGAGRYPQMLLRIGASKPAVRSPRRPVAAVLTDLC